MRPNFSRVCRRRRIFVPLLSLSNNEWVSWPLSGALNFLIPFFLLDLINVTLPKLFISSQWEFFFTIFRTTSLKKKNKIFFYLFNNMLSSVWCIHSFMTTNIKKKIQIFLIEFFLLVIFMVSVLKKIVWWTNWFRATWNVSGRIGSFIKFF